MYSSIARILDCTVTRKYNGTTISDTQLQKNIENNVKGHFQFVDDNKMSYKYILSITWTWMGQLHA